MQKKKLHIIMLFLLLAVFTAGCGEQGGRVTDGSEVYVKRQAEDNEEESEEEEEEQEQEKHEEEASHFSWGFLVHRKQLGFTGLNNLNRFQIRDHAWS